MGVIEGTDNVLPVKDLARSKTRKPRKVISDVPFPSFRLRHRVYSKTRKMKTWKIFSEVSEISEKSEFSNCHF